LALKTIKDHMKWMIKIWSKYHISSEMK
jgi:hypothetical protein